MIWLNEKTVGELVKEMEHAREFAVSLEQYIDRTEDISAEDSDMIMHSAAMLKNYAALIRKIKVSV